MKSDEKIAKQAENTMEGRTGRTKGAACLSNIRLSIV